MVRIVDTADKVSFTVKKSGHYDVYVRLACVSFAAGREATPETLRTETEAIMQGAALADYADCDVTEAGLRVQLGE